MGRCVLNRFDFFDKMSNDSTQVLIADDVSLFRFQVDVKDWQRLLRLAGLPWTREDALACLHLADREAETMRWPGFRRVLYTRMLDHSMERYYNELAVHVPRTSSDGSKLKSAWTFS